MIISVQNYAQTWTLQQCIDTAQTNNKNLQISKNEMLISSEKEKEVKANLLPKIKLAADYKYFIDLPYQLMPASAFGGPEGIYNAVQFGTPHNINVGLQAALPLYNPELYGGMKTAKTAVKLNQLKYKKTQETVFFDISNLYYNAQILKHQITFIDSNLTNTEKLLKTVELLYNQKLAKKTDVEKIKLQKATLNTQRETAMNNLTQIINLLKLNMGIPAETKLDVETEIKYKNNITYEQKQNIDIQIAGTRKELLETELKTIKNSRLPSVSAYANYSQTGFGYDGEPESFLDFYTMSFVGLQITAPIFNGTVTKRKISRKKIEIDNSKLQTELLSDQNNIQIENAVKQRNIASKNIADTENQINLAQSIYNQTILQQKQGVASLTDVLMADGKLKEAQQDNIAAIINYLKADLELKKLTGNINLSK
ncbi:MAG: TolC family protein [Chlorobi bacterium]|nr:TolC family protein [Chlorobiota bacterium]